MGEKNEHSLDRNSVVLENLCPLFLVCLSSFLGRNSRNTEYAKRLRVPPHKSILTSQQFFVKQCLEFLLLSNLNEMCGYPLLVRKIKGKLNFEW